MRDLVIYLIGINVLTFLIYGIDKWKARRGKWRIPEDTLLGMYLFRHKTQHRKFTLGVPAILLVRQPKRQRLFHRRASHRPTGGKIRLPGYLLEFSQNLQELGRGHHNRFLGEVLGVTRN